MATTMTLAMLQILHALIATGEDGGEVAVVFCDRVISDR